jgi:hypothetical protein
MTLYGRSSANPTIPGSCDYVENSIAGLSFISEVRRSDHFVEPLALMAAFLLLAEHKSWKVRQDDGRISHR